MALMAEIMKVQEPTNLDEAMADQNWKAAMQEEYDNIMKNQTWDLVDRPVKRSLVPNGYGRPSTNLMDLWKSTRLGLLHKDTLKLKVLILRIPLLP